MSEDGKAYAALRELGSAGDRDDFGGDKGRGGGGLLTLTKIECTSQLQHRGLASTPSFCERTPRRPQEGIDRLRSRNPIITFIDRHYQFPRVDLEAKAI
jgi:hypothetical protein